jgi:excisionase family DNA binding protein
MKYITPKEAAEILGVTQSRIRQYLRQGLLPNSVKTRGTRWEVYLGDVEAIKKGEIDVTARKRN